MSETYVSVADSVRYIPRYRLWVHPGDTFTVDDDDLWTLGNQPYWVESGDLRLTTLNGVVTLSGPFRFNPDGTVRLNDLSVTVNSGTATITV